MNVLQHCTTAHTLGSSYDAALLPSHNFYCSKYTSISDSSGSSSSSSSSDGSGGSTRRNSLVIVELFSLL
jgi:hypothetical protein